MTLYLKVRVAFLNDSWRHSRRLSFVLFDMGSNVIVRCCRCLCVAERQQRLRSRREPAKCSECMNSVSQRSVRWRKESAKIIQGDCSLLQQWTHI
jgi:hypothetical protein